ncbi:MAG TPA: ATP-dependent DNA helicase UvrD2 [Acidimicrobiales bacterium]|nr:ATP-dependent DNA helicase UvrD2 [Acidimicrobiales bacterium]
MLNPVDPVRLGRSAVVRPGQPAPRPWSACERVRVSAVDPETAERLHAAWRERLPLVIELPPGLGLDDPAVAPPERITGLQPWEWPVDLDLPGERLHHGVWANSVDARQPDRPPMWRWADDAARLGARSGADGADVTLPDGRPAVCDGGPLDASLPGRLGLPVVHRISIEHRSLQPLGESRTDGLDLAPDQLAAVGEPVAGARIIAPAGSGKTRVLTERARLVVNDWNLPPAALALVAYNVRAAGEMRQRLSDVEGLRIRTLNALGLRLCGRASTVDEPQVRRLLGDLVSFPRRAETDPAAPWIEALGRVRLGLTDPALVEEDLPDVSDLDRVARAYRDELSQRDMVDFDEQVTGAIERLLADPAFRARSQRYARVLLIDEFQDLTPAHLLLIRLLCGPAGAVFAVGDDDQTIYGYAGATPRWLVDFQRWFPGSAQHSLEVNYRCPPEVVSAASNLLSRNAIRVPKTIRAASRPDPGGPGRALEVVRPTSAADGPGPARRTAARVEALLAGGARPDGVAVLSRVNASLVPVQVLLRHRGVEVDGGVERRFLQRGGVRGAMAWLEVATAPDGHVPAGALREAARRPKRAFSNGLLDLVARPRSFESLGSLADWLAGKGSARDAEKVEQLARDVALVRRAASGTTAQVLRVVRRQIGAGGLDASASALDQWSHGSIAAHVDDLEALTELADLEPDPALFPRWLSEELAAPSSPGGVTLASIHAVKGREWPHVVLHHVTDGLMPHRLADDPEEERRVFHVGITRASETVALVPGSPPSSFLEEMDRPGRPPDPAGRPAGGAGRLRRAEQDPGRTGDPGRAGDAGDPGRRGDRRRPPGDRGGERPGREAATADLLPAVGGTEFTTGGHHHTVVEARPDGAVSLVGGGPARTVTAFGSVVVHEGRAALLAHPGADRAWDQLRSWRRTRAKEQGVPPYVVFDDKTLKLVAALLPVTEPGLLAISGIGPVKVESYGSDLMAITEAARESAAGSGPD